MGERVNANINAHTSGVELFGLAKRTLPCRSLYPFNLPSLCPLFVHVLLYQSDGKMSAFIGGYTMVASATSCVHRHTQV